MQVIMMSQTKSNKKTNSFVNDKDFILRSTTVIL